LPRVSLLTCPYGDGVIPGMWSRLRLWLPAFAFGYGVASGVASGGQESRATPARRGRLPGDPLVSSNVTLTCPDLSGRGKSLETPRFRRMRNSSFRDPSLTFRMTILGTSRVALSAPMTGFDRYLWCYMAEYSI